MSDSDDEPQLSAHALAALSEFYNEQAEVEGQLKSAQESGDVGNVTLKENWQLSQFWYSEETALKLAQESLRIAGDNGRIACISAPTAYKKIREIKPETCTAKCLEFDERFQMFGEDFQFYDYNDPLKLPEEWKQSFDVVLADPPFLSEECLCQTAMTARFLAKEKIILCTGAVMKEMALKLLSMKPCSFQPQHTNQLQNEFKCYTNYDGGLLNAR